MGGQKSGTPWRPPLQMCTSSFMSAVIASSSAPLKHPYISTFPTLLIARQQRLYLLAWWNAHVSKLARIPQGGRGGLNFCHLGGGGGFCSGGGGSLNGKLHFPFGGGGCDNTFSLSVHDMQQQGFTFANREGGG